MRDKEPVPEIPPVPVRRVGGNPPRTRPSPERSPEQHQPEQPALFDLLDAFWGDHDNYDRAPEADSGNAQPPASSQERDQRRSLAAARSTQRPKTSRKAKSGADGTVAGTR